LRLASELALAIVRLEHLERELEAGAQKLKCFVSLKELVANVQNKFEKKSPQVQFWNRPKRPLVAVFGSVGEAATGLKPSRGMRKNLHVCRDLQGERR
jgi:hypothetical protein